MLPSGRSSHRQILEEATMTDVYRVFGAEMSPYSVKVRAYFRYKGIPHQWILRNAESQADYAKYAKLPIIPLVVTPLDVGIQDSTPIIDKMAMLRAKYVAVPDRAALDPILAAAGCLTGLRA